MNEVSSARIFALSNQLLVKKNENLDLTFSLIDRVVNINFSDIGLHKQYSSSFMHHPQTTSENCDLEIFVIGSKNLPINSEFVSLVDKMRETSKSAQNSPIYFSSNDQFNISAQWNSKGEISTIYLYLKNTKKAVAWINTEATESLHDDDEIMSIAAPFRAILAWHYVQNGFYLFHASAIGNANAGVAFVGQSGSGKSSTSLICLNSNLQYCGDDSVLVSNQAVPRIHSLYCSARLNVEDLRYYPLLQSKVSASNKGKECIYFSPGLESLLVSDIPLVAMIIPKLVADAKTSYQKVSKIEMLAALAASSLLHVPVRDSSAEFKSFSEIVDKISCYRMNLGRDREDIPKYVQEILNSNI